MAGIDRILAKELSREIKKNLDKDVLKRLERELFLENGMSIKLSMEHFSKFHSKLKKILAGDVLQFEEKCLDTICKLKKDKNGIKLKILDELLNQKIIEHYGDSETRKVLKVLMSKDLPIPKILRISGVPKTSGYRKIENLILDGLLVESGKVLSESKKVSKYKCVFEDIKMEIKSNVFVIIGTLSQKEFEKSTIMKSIHKV